MTKDEIISTIHQVKNDLSELRKIYSKLDDALNALEWTVDDLPRTIADIGEETEPKEE